MGLNSFEQLKTLELKANFTPSERRYFDKLRDELEAIVGGVPLEALTKPSDAKQAGRIRAKLEEMLKFVKDRKMDKIEVVDRESFIEWLESFNLVYDPERWVSDHVEFSTGKIICRESLDFKGKEVTCLPDNLHVMGELDLEGCQSLRVLPFGLRVEGVLWLNNCMNLHVLPHDLDVDVLSALNCVGITEIPDSIRVRRSLTLDGCSHVERLPDNLALEGFLSLQRCTGLKQLPKNLKVNESLNLSDCKNITNLPSDLKVGRDIILTGLFHSVYVQAGRLKARNQIGRDIK